MPADTILSTLIVLFTGEFLPKTLFKSNPNRLLSIFSPIAYLCYVVLWPISKFSTFLSKCLLRLVGMKMDAEGTDEGFSKVDLDYLVQSSIDNATNEDEINDEVKIFQNALDFSDTKVRDCMVPRTEILPPSFTLAGSYPYTSFCAGNDAGTETDADFFAAEEVFGYRCR